MGFWRKAGKTYLYANIVAGAFMADVFLGGEIRDEFHTVAKNGVTESGMDFVITDEGHPIVFAKAAVGDQICAKKIEFGPVSSAMFKTIMRVKEEGRFGYSIADGFMGFECDADMPSEAVQTVPEI